jgi:hypothetical protein
MLLGRARDCSGRSFQRLLDVKAGFEPENAVAMTAVDASSREEADRRPPRATDQQLLPLGSALPGCFMSAATNALADEWFGRQWHIPDSGGRRAGDDDGRLGQQLTALPAPAGKR